MTNNHRPRNPVVEDANRWSDKLDLETDERLRRLGRQLDANRDFPQRRPTARDALVMLMWLGILVGLITLVAVVGG